MDVLTPSTAGPRLRALVAIAILAAGGCYAPDLRDCTVTCGASDECADGQACNPQGFCTAEGVTCMAGSGGATVDAPSATRITLRVQVMGTGKVVVDGVGECADSECTWEVPTALLRFTAQQLEAGKPFERWTTTNCGGGQVTQPSCVFTAAASTTVGAKFK